MIMLLQEILPIAHIAKYFSIHYINDMVSRLPKYLCNRCGVKHESKYMKQMSSLKRNKNCFFSSFNIDFSFLNQIPTDET